MDAAACPITREARRLTGTRTAGRDSPSMACSTAEINVYACAFSPANVDSWVLALDKAVLRGVEEFDAHREPFVTVADDDPRLLLPRHQPEPHLPI